MSEEVKVAQSIVQLKSHYFDECTFVRRGDPVVGEAGGVTYEFNFNREITKLNEEKYIVKLRANVQSEGSDAVEIHTRIVGVFTVRAENKEAKRSLINLNTMTILFPFVRSQIILVTAQVGLPTVELPVVNIAEMFPNDPLPGEETE